jgi:hypothetical protein
MRHDFDAALDDCLNLMRAGADAQACLVRYPQYADELRPLLQVAADVRAVTMPEPRAAARMAGQQRMLSALAQRRTRRRAETRSVRRVWRWAVAVIAVAALVGVGGTTAASAASLPGDALYPVKLAAQQIQLTLTLDASARQQLTERFSAQRRQDVQMAMQARRQVNVELRGTLEQLNQDTWIVSGLTVRLQAETVVVGQPYLGAQVTVRGYLPGDGSLVATRLVTDDVYHPSPTATSRPTVQSSETPGPTPTNTPTWANTPASTGARPTDTPTPTPINTSYPTDTCTPTPTSIPAPTAMYVLTPTETYTPTPTPTCTLEPTATHTPSPTSTSVPTATFTPTPTSTSVPTATFTPTPTSTPKPTATSTTTPTHTPEPTVTPTPTACMLYPIALHRDTVLSVVIGQQLLDIPNGTGSGNFGWLSWMGTQGELTLVQSLTPPGDSGTYINPNNPSDHTLSVTDWVHGRPGVANSNGVRDALDALKPLIITVPVWDTAAGQGGNLKYHVIGFAHIQITDYQLQSQNKISIVYWGTSNCP